MKKIGYFIYLLLAAGYAGAKVYYCMDAQGQRIFSDKPCAEAMIGKGTISNYEEGNLSVQKVPIVSDEKMADQIRYRVSPAQIKKKYCAKYSQAERDRLVQTKQVVLGMYLADVIKVWGAPVASDGNRILFQDHEDTVTVSLLEGCVINIERNYMSEDEFFDPETSATIENDVND